MHSYPSLQATEHISTVALSLALDGLLTPEEQRAFDLHLHRCPSCRSRWLTWQQLDRMLSAAPLVGPAPGFARRVDQRLHRRQRRRERLLGSLVLVGGTLLAWTAVVVSTLLAVGAWLALNPTAQLHLGELIGVLGQLAGLAVSSLLAARQELVGSPALPVVTLLASMVLLGLAVLWLRLIPPRQASPNP